MEKGPNAAPGRIVFDGSWQPLAELEAEYRDQSLIADFQLTSRDVDYELFHVPPEPDTDGTIRSKYFFIGISGLEYDESDNKLFALTIDGENQGLLRVYETREIDIYAERERSGRSDLPEELLAWVNDDIDMQARLGSDIPNDEDMEQFEEIVRSWARHQ